MIAYPQMVTYSETPFDSSYSSLKESLCFDDVNIKPRYSEIESRTTIKTECQFTKNFRISIPIIASCMDSICELEMATELWRLGGVGAIHRFMTIEEQVKQIDNLHTLAFDGTPHGLPSVLCAAIGVNGDSFIRAQRLINAGCNVLIIDVAHGHHINVRNMLEQLINWREQNHKQFDIIAGNIATAEGAIALEEWGADAIRAGVGSGGACLTRINTGIGIPSFSMLQEISNVTSLPVIADGGIKHAGDACKALAVGSSTIMCGSYLSGSTECPGERKFINGQFVKAFRGSASAAIKVEKTGEASYIEGDSMMVADKGPVQFLVERFVEGIQSCASYLGVESIEDMCKVAEFTRITGAGFYEGTAHAKSRS